MLNKKIFVKFCTQTLKDYNVEKDHIIKGFSKSLNFRFTFLQCSQSVQTSIKRFQITNFENQEILGNIFQTSLLISSMLKGDERIKAVINYPQDNKIHEYYAESMANGEIRGFFKINNGDLVEPYLSVSKVLYNHKEAQKSVVPLKLRNQLQYSSEELMEYFKTSEQILSFCDLNSFQSYDSFKSNGFLIQKSPNAFDEEIATIFEQILYSDIWQDIKLGHKSMNISQIQSLLQKLDPDIYLSRYPVHFYCRCKKQDFVNMLKTFQKDVILDIKQKNQGELVCHYCNQIHVLNDQDYNYLLE